jgi:hypothetical protein
MQFADSAGNIAAGDLIQANTLYYFIFQIFLLFLREILRGRGMFHAKGACKHLRYIILKGYLPPFVSALKGNKFPFASCQKD